MRLYLLFLTFLFCGISFAQNSITGIVTDENNQTIAGANIKLAGGGQGAISGYDGSFAINSSQKLPFAITVSAVGYSSSVVNVESASQKVNVQLRSEETKLNEIVVSATRTPERVLESPVTIERMSIKDIKKTASATFYDGLENMKDVQMNTSSLTFKSVNTRGFATVANTRFMQLVDGMDNSSPLLNFVIGNMIGVSEIDVQSVELLPGASSALYGANAFNGILFMNSKSPFVYQGISAYAKFGQTSQKAAGSNDYVDYGVRMAHAFNDYFAVKANFTFLHGTDWYATNYNDKTISGIDRNNINYDGINVYGDEVSTNIKSVGQSLADLGMIPAGAVNLLPNTNVSRTGYNEIQLTDNKASNTKIDFSLHLRPFGNEKLEVIWQSKFGYGNAVYQGANRYYLNNFFMQQHKIEFKGKNFFLRGYTTTEDGGKSYDMLFTGININREWKDDKTWFGQYAAAYAQSTLGGQTPEQAHISARNYSDYNIIPAGIALPAPSGKPRAEAGTPEFIAAFNKVINEADVTKGSKLVDNSIVYHSDINYNFKDIVKFAEIQVGGSYRQYELNSHGRIYNDASGPIHYNEYGIYTQVTKKMMDDRLKLAGSLRYDKSKNFEGSYSPRVSMVYSAGESKKHNFRASYQTGFRNPSTQDQYIAFNVGSALLLGSAPDNLSSFNETLAVAKGTPAVGQIYASGDPLKPSTQVTLYGMDAYNNSYTSSSVKAFSEFSKANPGDTPGAAAKLRKTNVDYVKPEQVKAFEIGYRSLIRNVSIDVNAYYNVYNNFIGNLNVVAPLYGTASESFNFSQGVADPIPYLSNKPVQSLHALSSGNYRVYQLYTNTDVEIKSLGLGLGLSNKVYKDFEVGVNYNYSQFNFDQEKDPSFEAGFNTPKHRVKATLGNEKVFANFGFNLSGRWNSAYLWQSTMADGMIESATVIDAQINYSIPSIKSVFKIGAANIGGKEYTQVIGAGSIGQQYFASFTIKP
jgi:outer membrane receptor for ferrienterochelin and colicin